MLKQEVLSLMTGMYIWFNRIAVPATDFKKEELEKYFTPDFVMDMNDRVMTSDYDSLYNHFEKFRKSDAVLKVQLPLKEVVFSDDLKKCVVRYNIKSHFKDDSVKNIEVIAIWHISDDGRLQRMNEVVCLE